jgi:hypothetical protein
MNRQQRLRSLERSASVPTSSTSAGWWCTGGQGLTLFGLRYPRGARIPDEIISVLAPNRLAILTSGGFLHHRLDALPPNLPTSHRVIQDDPRVAKQQRENMRVAGDDVQNIRVGSAGLLPQNPEARFGPPASSRR